MLFIFKIIPSNIFVKVYRIYHYHSSRCEFIQTNIDYNIYKKIRQIILSSNSFTSNQKNVLYPKMIQI